MPIFDQGYQHWQGQLSGRLWRWWTITRYGVRAQLKSRWTRIVVLIAFVPAIGLATALVLWGLLEQKSDLVMPIVRFIQLPPELADGPKAFRVAVWTVCYRWFFEAELFLSMILILLVGPGLVSQDLRFNAIPLYLSRPVRRFDYFAGKLGVIGTFLAAVVIVPAVVAYVLGLLFSLDVTVLRDTWHLLVGSIAYGLVIVLSAGLLMLALSSLSRSSRYVSVFWVGTWFVSSAVAGALLGFQAAESERQMRRMSVELQRGLVAGNQAQAAQSLEEEMQRLLTERLEQLRNNWRPLFSYTGNLQRIGNQLLDTQRAWLQLAEVFDPSRLVGRRGGGLGRRGPRGPSFAEVMAAEHPWPWSAGVLAGLFGISLWILTTRVKSLDRLK